MRPGVDFQICQPAARIRHPTTDFVDPDYCVGFADNCQHPRRSRSLPECANRGDSQERDDKEGSGFHFEKIYPNNRRDARISVSAYLVVVTQFYRGAFSSPGVYAWGRNRRALKAPLNGALKSDALLFPAVNGWATEKSFQNLDTTNPVVLLRGNTLWV